MAHNHEQGPLWLGGSWVGFLFEGAKPIIHLFESPESESAATATRSRRQAATRSPKAAALVQSRVILPTTPFAMQNNSPSLADFEAAVLIVLRPPSSPDEQARFSAASAFIQSLSARADASSLALHLLGATSSAPARFFCLQALASFAGSGAGSAAARAEVRAALLAFARAREADLAAEGAYVRTKLARARALCVKYDYPGAWPSAAHDLVALLGGGSATLTDIFLRTLQCLQDEVVDPRINRSAAELAQNMAVKDALRASGDIATFATAWMGILDTFLASPGGSALGVDSVRACLNVMAAWADWCDVAMFAAPAFVTRYAALLPVPCARAGVAAVLRALVRKGMDARAKAALIRGIGIVTGVVTLTGAVEAALGAPGAADDPSPYGSSGADEDSEFGELVGELVALLGNALLAAGAEDALNSAAGDEREWIAAAIRATADAAIRLLNVSAVDVGVGIAVSPFLVGLVACLHRERNPRTNDASARPAGVSASEFMPRILTSVPNVLAALPLPLSGDGLRTSDADDADDATELRDGLQKFLINAVRAAPDAILAFLTSEPNGLLRPTSVASFGAHSSRTSAAAAHVQVALSLVYVYGDGAPSAAVAGTPLAALVFSLLRGCVPAADTHASVTLAWLEVAARYAPLLVDAPDLVSTVLFVALGPAGLRSDSRALRSRTTYLLLKFVKALIRPGSDGVGAGAGLLVHFLAQVLESLHSFLAVPFLPPTVLRALERRQAMGARAAVELGVAEAAELPATPDEEAVGGLSHTDAQFLFEVAGVLLGAPGVDVGARVGYTSAVLGPLLTAIEGGLTALAGLGVGGGTGADLSPILEAHVGAWVVRVLNAIGHVTKGFGSVADEPALAALAERAVGAGLAAVRILPSHSATRTKTFFLLHRAVDCLDVRLVPLLPATLGALVDASSCAEDVTALLVLINQLTAKFKIAIAPTLASLLIPVTGRVATAMNEPLPSAPADAAEAAEHARARADVARTFSLFLNVLVTAGVAADVLLAPSNAPRLWDVLSLAVDVARAVEPAAAKTVLIFAGALVRSWLPVAAPATTGMGTNPAALSSSAAPSPLSQQLIGPFASFAVETFGVRAGWGVLCTDTFDATDAQCAALASEVVALHSAIALHVGAVSGADVGAVIAALVGSPAAAALGADAPSRDAYAERLRAAIQQSKAGAGVDLKPAKAALLACCSQRRRK